MLRLLREGDRRGGAPYTCALPFPTTMVRAENSLSPVISETMETSLPAVAGDGLAK